MPAASETVRWGCGSRLAWRMGNNTQSKGPSDDELLTIAGGAISCCKRNQNLSGRIRLPTGQQSYSPHVSRTRRNSSYFTDLPVFFELGLSRFRPKNSSYSSTLRCLASSRARLPAGLGVGGDKKRQHGRGGCRRVEPRNRSPSAMSFVRCFVVPSPSERPMF